MGLLSFMRTARELTRRICLLRLVCKLLLLFKGEVVHLLNALETLRVYQEWRSDVGYGLRLLRIFVNLGCT